METNNSNPESAEARKNRYTRILEDIFKKKYKPGDLEVAFTREEIVETANALGVALPKNLGDLPYTFRYRSDIPESIRKVAPKGMSWVIWPAGRSKYRLAPAKNIEFIPRTDVAETKIPDSTPGIIAMYTLGDEQALLAQMRYNRLVDIATGITSYSLQSHLRTTVGELGQVERDEVYVGIDKRGAQYVFPVQAKSTSDVIGVVQIAQDMAMCKEKFPSLHCRPIGAKFLDDSLIAMLEFAKQETEIVVVSEKHYRLVPPSQVTDKDLVEYSLRSE
jgi:hypothetical protein